MEFFKNLLNGYTFEQIGEHFDGVLNDFKALDVFKYVFEGLDKLGDFKPFVFVALAAILLLFGQKLMCVVKYIVGFAIGAGLGLEVLYPAIESIGVHDWIVALACGVIGFLLAKIIYIVAIAFIAGYAVYDVVLLGMIPFLTGISDNKIIAGAAAAVVIALVLIFRKFFERLATPCLGAKIIVDQILVVWTGYEAFAGGNADLFKWIAMGVLALVGIIVQIATRKRY